MVQEKTLNKENKSPHANHRARMREKVLKNGAEIFHDHELLEMLLFACDSRRNTNGTAHDLLERFGSLRGVIMADPDALMGVPNVKDAATSHILVVREILKRMGKETLGRSSDFNSYDEIGKYFVELFRFVAVEELHLAMLDNNMRMIGCVRVCKGTVNSAPACTRAIMTEVINNKETSNVVIAHNHPGGKLIASPEDAITTRTISTMLNAVGVVLMDHILVVDDRYTSILNTQYGL